MLYIEPSTGELISMLMGDQYSGWTYEEAEALVEYLAQLSEETGENIEFQPVNLRCEFSGYDSLEDFQAEYGSDDYPDWETVGEHTLIIYVADDHYIVQAF